MACTAGPMGIDRAITVAGGELDVWCDGGEGPTIIFLAAIGGDDTLLPIAERFSDEANACFYFRPGDGETAAPPDPRSAASDAADLHELIVSAELATPAILVAHSYGGLIAMTAAAEHHEDVAGIFFVDSSVPEANERFYPSMTDARMAIPAPTVAAATTPSGARTATDVTEPPRSIAAASSPEARLHAFTPPSWPPLQTRSLGASRSSASTCLRCLPSTDRWRRVGRSQTRTVLSDAAVMTVPPSGDIRTALTADSCPTSSPASVPSSVQMRACPPNRR